MDVVEGWNSGRMMKKDVQGESYVDKSWKLDKNRQWQISSCKAELTSRHQSCLQYAIDDVSHLVTIGIEERWGSYRP